MFSGAGEAFAAAVQARQAIQGQQQQQALLDICGDISLRGQAFNRPAYRPPKKKPENKYLNKIKSEIYYFCQNGIDRPNDYNQSIQGRTGLEPWLDD